MIKYDKIWFLEPAVLFRLERLNEFYPSEKMSFSEKLNAVVRLCFYISIFLLLLGYSYHVVYIPIIIMLFTYFMYKRYDTVVSMERFKTQSNCEQPTNNNPFMNILLTDYDKGEDRKPACTVEDNPDIDKTVEDKFNINLYRDVDDVWSRQNSQRQYFTMPWTSIPNDQEGLGDWLYKTGPTLKERDIIA
jgi:hypothetical protein